MSFLEDLLTGRSPSLNTQSLSTISPEQREQLNRLLTQLSTQQPTAFGGGMNAGLSAGERASLSALEERSRMLARPDANLQTAGETIRGQQDIEANTADVSAFFRDRIQQPLVQSFGREILPQISRQFGGGSFFSSERQAAEGLAREDLLEALTGEKSAVEMDQFNLARQRALIAAGLAPNLSDADLRRGGQQIDILGAQGIEREVEQAGLDRNYLEFVRQQEEAARIQQMMQQLTITPTIENIGMTDPGNAGLLNTLLGALAAGAGEGLGGNLSDLLGSLFGGSEAAGGGASADAATGAGSGAGALAGGGAGVSLADLIANIQPGIQAGVDETTAAGGAALGALPQPGLAGTATPGGSATIFEGAGLDQLASQVGSAGAGAGGLASLFANMQPGIAAGVAGTNASTLASLLGRAPPTLAPIAASAGGAGAGAGAGAGINASAAESAARAAGAPAGSGSSIASGVGTAFAVAGALYGTYSTVEAAMAGDKQSAALSGAATGAAIGSIVPVVGTAVGAVIGGLVGLVGAAFGREEKASERAYGTHKDLPTQANVRNWDMEHVYGAQFESIKSHTKSGNIKRFEDVADLFSAFGINHNAHKNIENMQNQFNSFIKGVIETAQGAGGLPTSPEALAKLDGQQIYYQLIAPAMAAKVQETTGKPATSNSWSGNLKGLEGKSALHNVFADVTDYIIANWGTPFQERHAPTGGGGGARRTGFRVQQR